MHDPRQATVVAAPQDGLLALPLHVDHRVHVQHALPGRGRQDLIDLHSHRVRQLVFQSAQRGLADQFGDAGLGVVVGDVVIWVELRSLGQLLSDDVHQGVQLESVLGGQWDDVHLGAVECFGEHGVQAEQLLANPVFGDLVGLGDDAHQRHLGRDLADVLHDPAVTGSDFLIGWHAHTDQVHVHVGFLDHVVEPLAQQCARPVQARGVHDDDLGLRAMHEPTDRVAGGFRLIGRDGDLLPNQGIRQRGLTGIRPAHEAHEAGAEALGRVEAEPSTRTVGSGAACCWVGSGIGGEHRLIGEVHLASHPPHSALLQAAGRNHRVAGQPRRNRTGPPPRRYPHRAVPPPGPPG